MSDDHLRQIAMRHGVFLRREAVAVGLDDRSLKRALLARALVRVRHGAYTFTDLHPQTDTERAVLHARAVMRTHADHGALSHTSAALLRPVDSWGLDLTHTHVTRLGSAPARQSRDVSYHESRCTDEDLERVLGVRATKMPRALVETAAVNSVEAAVVLFDSALQKKLVTRQEILAAAASMAGWPGTQHVDLALRLMDGRAQSVGESRSRYLMWSHAIPLPELQYEVRDASGNLVGFSDFAWPRHGVLGEFDGRSKYLEHLREGESPADAVFREKRREDRLRLATGWSVIRLVWSDLQEPGRTAEQIRLALRRGC